jgi:hypothetical protein
MAAWAFNPVFLEATTMKRTILVALTLSVTLATPARAQTTKSQPYSPPTTKASLLPGEPGNHNRRIELCDTESTCRTVSLPRRTGNVTRIIQNNFVPDDKTAGSFLTFSEQWVSMCYASPSNKATTCTPMIEAKYLIDFEVNLRTQKDGPPVFEFIPRRAATPDSATMQLGQHFMRGMQKATKTLTRHAVSHFMGRLPMASLTDAGGGGGCSLDDEGGYTCGGGGGSESGGGDGGGGGDEPWEEGWPEPDPAAEPQPDIPIIVITGQREVPAPGEGTAA